MNILRKNKTYLDYAGATPVCSEVISLMNKVQKKYYANPSSIFEDGVVVRNKIEESRSKIASFFNAHSDEIIFTGSGTESDAMAIIGVVDCFMKSNPNKKPHLITSKIEHPAVLENFKELEKKGIADVSYIPVNKEGQPDLDFLSQSINERTILVSMMYANNEIGSIFPIEEIAKIIRHYRKKNETRLPFLHSDGCQAINYLFVENIEKLGVDLFSFNSSKIYGPKGIGVLFKKRDVPISPIYFGGGQEFGLRSGTESVDLISGLTLALEKTLNIKKYETERLTKLRDYLIDGLLNINSKFKITLNGGVKNRLPNNVNVSIEKISSELMVIELSGLGFFVSEKSACKSEDDAGSYVISSLYEQEGKEINGSLRITMGRQTKKKDVLSFLRAFEIVLKKYEPWL